MPWVRAQFKGRKVWAAATADGTLREDGGRVAIRYSDSEGSKIYQAGARGVRAIAGGELRDLPTGSVATPAARPTAGGARASRGSGFGSAGRRTQAQAEAAVASVQEIINGLDPQSVRAFTDGACLGNPGPCGAGALVVFPDGTTVERARDLGHGTNNVGELTALILALNILDEQQWPLDAPAALFTDSSYAIGILTKGWKAKKNKELIAELRTLYARRAAAAVHWVPGHAGLAENERADALASGAARGEERG